MIKQGIHIKTYIAYAVTLMIMIVLSYPYFFHSPVKINGKINKTALMDCFPKNSTIEKKGKQKAIVCEASGVVYLEKQNKVIIVHDKSVPSAIGSAIFESAYSQEQETLANASEYLTNNAVNNAEKYEDISLTPDRQYVIATTAFDRIRKGETGWDNYNSLVYWSVNNPDGAKTVSLSNTKEKNSVHLREKFAKALGLVEPYYFKIEGLTILENNQLLFGIREVGESYKKFDYTFKIVSVSYAINEGQLTLANDFKSYVVDVGNTGGMGLSGLDYDVDQQLLYILGSYEKENAAGKKQLGGALWILTLDDFNAHKPPHQIMLDDKNPLYFSHKPEGITVLNAEQLLIIYDDDKELVTAEKTREAHQTAYSIIQLF